MVVGKGHRRVRAENNIYQTTQQCPSNLNPKAACNTYQTLHVKPYDMTDSIIFYFIKIQNVCILDEPSYPQQRSWTFVTSLQSCGCLQPHNRTESYTCSVSLKLVLNSALCIDLGSDNLSRCAKLYFIFHPVNLIMTAQNYESKIPDIKM